jgi:hypothetical protein
METMHLIIIVIILHVCLPHRLIIQLIHVRTHGVQNNLLYLFNVVHL